jgi:hypothetical protein
LNGHACAFASGSASRAILKKKRNRYEISSPNRDSGNRIGIAVGTIIAIAIGVIGIIVRTICSMDRSMDYPNSRRATSRPSPSWATSRPAPARRPAAPAPAVPTPVIAPAPVSAVQAGQSNRGAARGHSARERAPVVESGSPASEPLHNLKREAPPRENLACPKLPQSRVGRLRSGRYCP